VAVEIDDRIVDLARPITADSTLRLVTTRDPEAIEIMRHSAAHVMAQAVLRLYPEAKLTIGPVVEDGFYYDIDMEPISEEDFPKIEAEMKKSIAAREPFKRKEVSKAEALAFYKDEPFVQVCKTAPELKAVAGTNYCHVFPTLVKGRLVLFSAIDNLVKGASGQAIQNLNVLFGLPETMGLE
jgi:threonyl-tRNA synthetase